MIRISAYFIAGLIAAAPRLPSNAGFPKHLKLNFVSAKASSADFKLRRSGDEIAFKGSIGTDIKGKVYGAILDDGTELTYFIEPKGVTVALDRAGAKIRRIKGRCH